MQERNPIKTGKLKTAMLMLCMGIVLFTKAQEVVDSLAEKELVEIVVSGNKFAEKKKNIVQKIDIISSSYIRKANAQNMGDLLMSTGNSICSKKPARWKQPCDQGFRSKPRIICCRWRAHEQPDLSIRAFAKHHHH